MAKTVTLLGTPTNATDAATKGYVDGLAVPATSVQVFAASGTWTKPTGATSITVTVIGGGGGGGGARRDATTVARGGGGGGGGGGITEASFTVINLPASVAVTVGLSGTAGSAAATDTT